MGGAKAGHPAGARPPPPRQGADPVLAARPCPGEPGAGGAGRPLLRPRRRGERRGGGARRPRGGPHAGCGRGAARCGRRSAGRGAGRAVPLAGRRRSSSGSRVEARTPTGSGPPGRRPSDSLSPVRACSMAWCAAKQAGRAVDRHVDAERGGFRERQPGRGPADDLVGQQRLVARHVADPADRVDRAHAVDQDDAGAGLGEGGRPAEDLGGLHGVGAGHHEQVAPAVEDPVSLTG